MWEEGKASHGKLKNLYLMSYFSASDSVGRREAWAGILGICTGVLFYLFPVLPHSSHASVLPTMSAIGLNSSAELMRRLWIERTWVTLSTVSSFRIPCRFHPWYLPLFLESGHLASSLSIWFGSTLFPCSVFHYYLSYLLLPKV